MFRALVPRAERLPRPLARMEEELEGLMGRVFRPELGWWLPENGFWPKANVVETENTFEVTVELPGLKPEEVKVEVLGGALNITGEKLEEKEEKGKTFHHVERRHGEFRRAFELPGTVNAEKIEARFENGVLKVVVPKVEEAKPRHVEVKTG